MNNIITSTVNGIEFDPASITEDAVKPQDPSIELKNVIRDFDALLAEDEQTPKVVAPKLNPCYLQFSRSDRSNNYYFKCNLLAIDVSDNDQQITVEASQTQLLKLFSYWQHSLNPYNNKKIKVRSLVTLVKRIRLHPKVQLNRVYTYINGNKQEILTLSTPHNIIRMQYLVADSRPTLKIYI